MMYKEMKTFELNYPVIQFFVKSISLFFLLEGKVELATHLEIFIWFQFSYPFLLSGHIEISALYLYSHLFRTIIIVSQFERNAIVKESRK